MANINQKQSALVADRLNQNDFLAQNTIGESIKQVGNAIGNYATQQAGLERQDKDSLILELRAEQKQEAKRLQDLQFTNDLLTQNETMSKDIQNKISSLDANLSPQEKIAQANTIYEQSTTDAINSLSGAGYSGSKTLEARNGFLRHKQEFLNFYTKNLAQEATKQASIKFDSLAGTLSQTIINQPDFLPTALATLESTSAEYIKNGGEFIDKESIDKKTRLMSGDLVSSAFKVALETDTNKAKTILESYANLLSPAEQANAKLGLNAQIIQNNKLAERKFIQTNKNMLDDAENGIAPKSLDIAKQEEYIKLNPDMAEDWKQTQAVLNGRINGFSLGQSLIRSSDNTENKITETLNNLSDKIANSKGYDNLQAREAYNSIINLTRRYKKGEIKTDDSNKVEKLVAQSKALSMKDNEIAPWSDKLIRGYAEELRFTETPDNALNYLSNIPHFKENSTALIRSLTQLSGENQFETNAVVVGAIIKANTNNGNISQMITNGGRGKIDKDTLKEINNEYQSRFQEAFRKYNPDYDNNDFDSYYQGFQAYLRANSSKVIEGKSINTDTADKLFNEYVKHVAPSGEINGMDTALPFGYDNKKFQGVVNNWYNQNYSRYESQLKARNVGEFVDKYYIKKDNNNYFVYSKKGNVNTGIKINAN